MNRMKELREERGITMKEAASALDMPYTTYVNYEKGVREPNSETLIKIADFYNTSIDYLLCKPGAERIDEETLDKVNSISPDVLEQTGNIYNAKAAGINLLDESTGIDSSAIPGLLKEAIAKSGESIEEIAKKTSNLPETLQDIVSGRNYALPLWRIYTLALYFKIPPQKMIKENPNGSPSAIAAQESWKKIAEIDSRTNELSPGEAAILKNEEYEKLLGIETEKQAQLASLKHAVFPDSEQNNPVDLKTEMEQLNTLIDKIEDPKKQEELRKAVQSITKIITGSLGPYRQDMK